jgi:hypothetical protein
VVLRPNQNLSFKLGDWRQKKPGFPRSFAYLRRGDTLVPPAPNLYSRPSLKSCSDPILSVSSVSSVR